MGGCEEGEGKGTKVYGVVGMTDGPDCVSTLIVVEVEVVVAGTEDGVLDEARDDGDDNDEEEGEVILPPEWDEPRVELGWDDGCDCDGRVVRDK